MAKAFLFGIGGGNAVRRPVTVNFYSEGELYNTQTIQETDGLAVPPAPIKPSTIHHAYEFEGWSLDGTTVLNSFLAPVASIEVDYYAVFAEILQLETLANLANWKLSELDPILLSDFINKKE